MSGLGQTEKSGRVTGKSALLSITDIVSPACQVRFVPTCDISRVCPISDSRSFPPSEGIGVDFFVMSAAVLGGDNEAVTIKP